MFSQFLISYFNHQQRYVWSEIDYIVNNYIAFWEGYIPPKYIA